MAALEISVSKVNESIVKLVLKGYLDAYTFDRVENTINALFGKGLYKIIVDLTELEYISSAGAGVFIAAIGDAVHNGGNIALLKPNTNVRQVLELLGLTQFFTVAEDQEAALEAFRPSEE